MIGRAIRLTILLGVVFSVVTFLGKEVRPLYRASPWAEDPYDAFVSFATFFAPLITGLLLVRLPLCRRREPLAATRVTDMVRASKLLLATVVITLAGEWVALVGGAAAVSWSAVTALLVGSLVALSVLTLGAAWLIAAAPGVSDEVASTDAPEPDWLSDAVLVARLVSARAAELLDRVIVRPVRAHPTTAATALALLFGLALAATSALEEGLAPVLLLVIFVATCAMFAFLMAGGWYLRIVRTHEPLRGARGRTRDALVAAAAAVPVALTFRDLIWPMIGTSTAGAGVGELAWLVVGAGLLVFAAVLTLETALGIRSKLVL
jgi:hypothetical protein